MEKTFLVLGSAQGITEWCDRNLDKALAMGMILVAMNNAWTAHARIPELLKIWTHSTDFFYLPNAKPSDAQRDQWYEVTHYIDMPCWYSGKGGGTMILNTICHLLNLAYSHRRKARIYVAGSNLIYKEGVNHFYGKGTPDPLRLGKDFLQEQLRSVNGYAESQGNKIYNADYQEGTLLPFERIDL